MEATGWTFPTLAYVWEYRNRAILAGGDRLDAMSGEDRQRSSAELSARVRAMAGGLDDGWLVAVALWMVEDIYKSFFRGFSWSRGVHDYIAATAQPVVRELADRGLVLHYVIDATEGESNLATTLRYLPEVFRAAGLAVVGPQLVAVELLKQAEGEQSGSLTAMQHYRDEGSRVADDVVIRWHRERQSSVYLNFDLDDGLPALSLEVALSQRGVPGTIVILRNESPTEGSDAIISPPPGMELPPGMRDRPVGWVPKLP